MHRFITKAAIAVAALVGVVGLSSGTASAATHPRSNDGQACSDWTNDDGTHGTNCPAPSGGGLKRTIARYSVR